MKTKKQTTRKTFIPLMMGILLAACLACAKKNDPAVTTSGGGVSQQRSVFTIKGAAR